MSFDVRTFQQSAIFFVTSTDDNFCFPVRYDHRRKVRFFGFLILMFILGVNKLGSPVASKHPKNKSHRKQNAKVDR